ncbi:MAG TPA: hypothetical protein VMW52_09480, partial [Phycisphaerae bacterium]|nr:hypothetical protein [Phycisphaerae bacterium]
MASIGEAASMARAAASATVTDTMVPAPTMARVLLRLGSFGVPELFFFVVLRRFATRVTVLVVLRAAFFEVARPGAFAKTHRLPCFTWYRRFFPVPTYRPMGSPWTAEVFVAIATTFRHREHVPAHGTVLYRP